MGEKVGWGDGGLGTRERRPIDLVNLHRTRDGKREKEKKKGCSSLYLRALLVPGRLAFSRHKEKTLSDSLSACFLGNLYLSLSLSTWLGRTARWKTRRMLAPSTWTIKSASATLSRGDHLSSWREVWCSSEMIGTEKKTKISCNTTCCGSGIEITTSSTCSDRDAGNTRKRSLRLFV